MAAAVERPQSLEQANEPVLSEPGECCHVEDADERTDGVGLHDDKPLTFLQTLAIGGIWREM